MSIRIIVKYLNDELYSTNNFGTFLKKKSMVFGQKSPVGIRREFHTNRYPVELFDTKMERYEFVIQGRWEDIREPQHTHFLAF